MKLQKKINSNPAVCILVALSVATLLPVNSLYAGSDKQEVIVEDPCHDENLAMTVFVPKGSEAGSYFYEGKIYPIPVGQSVNLPSGSSQVNLPHKSIVTLVTTGANQRPVTDTYVITGATEVHCLTVNDIKENYTTIVPLGNPPEIPEPPRQIISRPETDGN